MSYDVLSAPPSFWEGRVGHLSRRGEKTLAQRLLTTATFAGCDPRELRSLVHAGREIALPQGWAFLYENTPADSAYVLLDGAATVFHGRDAVACVTAGDLIGEIGLLTDGLRSATVSTTGRLRALRVGYADLNRVLTRAPGLERRVLDLAGRRTGQRSRVRPGRALTRPDLGRPPRIGDPRALA